MVQNSPLVKCAPSNAIYIPFVWDIYSIVFQFKKLEDRYLGVLFMGYMNFRTMIKLWGPKMIQLKHFTSEKFDEWNNHFFK